MKKLLPEALEYLLAGLTPSPLKPPHHANLANNPKGTRSVSAGQRTIPQNTVTRRRRQTRAPVSNQWRPLIFRVHSVVFMERVIALAG